MNTVKLFPLAAASALLAANACAMTYLPGRFSETDKNGKWSTCVWGNNINFESPDMPGKPGPNDGVIVRGGWNFEIDQDINVGSLHNCTGTLMHASKRNIHTKRYFATEIPGWEGDSSTKLEDCNVQNDGAFSLRYWHEAKNAGRAEVQLIDTKFTNKGDITAVIPVNPIVTISSRAGFTLTLVGKTQFLVNGGAVLDSIFEESPTDWMFKWKLEEKDGKLPFALIAKKASFVNCPIEIKVAGSLKPGKYTLVEFADKKSGFKNPNFTLNDKPYTLGETVNVGGKSIKIELAPSPTGKDSKTTNDLVLEISK